MEVLSDLGQWLLANETVISAIAGLTAICVVLFTPVGRGIKRLVSKDGSTTAADGSAKPAPQRSKPIAPNRPSLVVLPFDNLSDDRELEFFADGLSEDLTTMLGRVPHYFVIARNTAFSYKGQALNLKTVGQELGVRYAIEGSVRKIGDNLRINVQLIETETGTHIWAEKNDAQLATIDTAHDDIAQSIAMDICTELTRVQAADASKRGTKDQDAWTYYEQAKAVLLFKGWNEKSFDETAALLRKAIKKDAEFAPAYGYLALILAIGHLVQLVDDPEKARQEAIESGEHALGLAPDSSEVLGFVGCAYSDLGMKAKGIPIIEKAIQLDETNAQAFAALGAAKVVNDEIDEGVADLERAIALSPQNAGSAPWKVLLSMGYAKQGKFDASMEMARQANLDDPKFYPGLIAIACSHVIQGDKAAAQEAIDKVFQLVPNLTSKKLDTFMGKDAIALLQGAGIKLEPAS